MAKFQRNQNNKWRVADKYTRQKHVISLKQVIFSVTVLKDEESIKDSLKKRGICLSKTDFALHSKLKFEIVNLALICQVCGEETINGTCFVCIGHLNSCQSTPFLEVQNEYLDSSFVEPQNQIMNTVTREEKQPPVNVSLSFQSDVKMQYTEYYQRRMF